MSNRDLVETRVREILELMATETVSTFDLVERFRDAVCSLTFDEMTIGSAYYEVKPLLAALYPKMAKLLMIGSVDYESGNWTPPGDIVTPEKARASYLLSLVSGIKCFDGSQTVKAQAENVYTSLLADWEPPVAPFSD